MVAGSVGAYTLVRREAAEAMAGAAIAVALVPPVATIGIALESGRADMAFGATLLVTADVVGVLQRSSHLSVRWFRARGHLEVGGGACTAQAPLGVVAALLMVFPLQWDGPGILSPPPESGNVDKVVQEWAALAPLPVEVINVVVEVSDGQANVGVVVAS